MKLKIEDRTVGNKNDMKHKNSWKQKRIWQTIQTFKVYNMNIMKIKGLSTKHRFLCYLTSNLDDNINVEQDLCAVQK